MSAILASKEHILIFLFHHQVVVPVDQTANANQQNEPDTRKGPIRRIKRVTREEMLPRLRNRFRDGYNGPQPHNFNLVIERNRDNSFDLTCPVEGCNQTYSACICSDNVLRMKTMDDHYKAKHPTSTKFLIANQDASEEDLDGEDEEYSDSEDVAPRESQKKKNVSASGGPHRKSKKIATAPNIPTLERTWWLTRKLRRNETFSRLQEGH